MEVAGKFLTHAKNITYTNDQLIINCFLLIGPTKYNYIDMQRDSSAHRT